MKKRDKKNKKGSMTWGMIVAYTLAAIVVVIVVFYFLGIRNSSTSIIDYLKEVLRYGR